MTPPVDVPPPGNERPGSPTLVFDPRPHTEIRFRLTQPPGVPLPFEPWFRHAPHARVHGVGVRLDGDAGSASIVAFPGSDADLDAFADDLEAMPAPKAAVWRLVERTAESFFLEYRWREPMYPGGIVSPMKVERDVLGPETSISFTLGPGLLVHRAVLPSDDVPHDLWTRLRDELLRYCGLVGTPVTLELERVGAHLPPGLSTFREASNILNAAVSLGYYDLPPRATVADVAAAAGVTGNLALETLRRAEREILDVMDM